jgi:hypothetical protein
VGRSLTKLCVNGMRNGVSAATGLGAMRATVMTRSAACASGSAAIGASVRRFSLLGKIARWSQKLALASEGRGLRWKNRGADQEQQCRGAASSAAVDGAGHGEEPPHRDRVHERVHRGEGADGVPAPTHAMLTAGASGARRSPPIRRMCWWS